VEVDLVTPADVNVPVNDGTVPFHLPAAVAWQERVSQTDAFIWISPEYHSAPAASPKNLLDYVTKEPMKGDVVGLCALAAGAMAALSTLNSMTTIARSLGAWVAPDYCALNSNEVKDGLNEGSARRLEAMCLGVIDAARRLHNNTPEPESLALE
jgi:NAD(P)H-dependent FMN reductase